MKTKERQSNIELLRIVAIFCVVLSHYSRHSGFDFEMDTLNINLMYSQITTLGNLGVNIFVLITGYFLSTKERPISNVIPILRATWFYSVIIYGLLCIFNLHKFNYIEAIKSLFPVITEEWWFITTYVMLMVFAPYLTHFIINISKERYINLLTTLFISWMIIPTFTNQFLKSNDLLWFFTLYLVGAYIHKYEEDFNRPLGYYGRLCAIVFGIFVFSVLALNILFYIYPSLGNHGDYFSGKQLILMPVLSVLLFLFFLKLPIKSNKVINSISSSTLGVYLIHDNHYIRYILWGGGRMISENSVWFIPCSIGIVIMVFLCCSVIEMFRLKIDNSKFFQTLFEKNEMFILNRINNVKKAILELHK